MNRLLIFTLAAMFAFMALGAGVALLGALALGAVLAVVGPLAVYGFYERQCANPKYWH